MIKIGFGVVFFLLLSCESRGQNITQSSSYDLSQFVNVSGYCESEDGVSYDLSAARRISNETLLIQRASGDYYLRFRDDILLVATEKSFEERNVFSIPDFIDTEDRLDIVLEFIEIDHKDYIYWKESFVNRIYKQGLLYFDGDNLYNVCMGDAGVSTRM
jgi:hypothetical protein